MNKNSILECLIKHNKKKIFSLEDENLRKYNSQEMTISFNSRYLIDLTSQIEHESILVNLKDSSSPVLINDPSDKNSFHVVMPMKI